MILLSELHRVYYHPSSVLDGHDKFQGVAVMIKADKQSLFRLCHKQSITPDICGTRTDSTLGNTVLVRALFDNNVHPHLLKKV
jgi:hypothetical protein